ncbi:STAS domain-containing protein [Actinosynnema sp. NPDC020468]|uniref:STAS domain-containing protein n=1 Tax=Actinosynnema sp. NPDC020468 TaxID=3154488 RepID=UPI0033E0381B
MTQPNTPGLTAEHVDGIAVLVVVGEIDMSNSDDLRTAAVDLLDSSTGLVLDLSGVTFFASSGIAALARLREHRASTDGPPVHLVSGSSVRRSLEVTAMDKLLPLHDTREQAVKAVRAED